VQCSAGNSDGNLLRRAHPAGDVAGEPTCIRTTSSPWARPAIARALAWPSTTSTGDAVASGILRNNIISAGNCRKRVSPSQSSRTRSARVVENNDLYPGPVSTTTDTARSLPWRGGTDAVTAASVNALAGRGQEHLGRSPKFVVVSRPTCICRAGSPCIDRGTSEGAPATDATATPDRPAPDSTSARTSSLGSSSAPSRTPLLPTAPS
jgi:hypothetical protein